MKISPYAVVIGLDGINGLQTARILTRKEIPVIGVAKNPHSYCCQTNVCEKILYTDTDNDELIDTLQALGSEFETKAVIYPCYDLNVLAVSRNRHKLDSLYHIVLPEAEIVEMMLHKTSFYAYAQREGFPIPRTFILNDRKDAELAAQKLTFPCILKPAVKSKNWDDHSKYKVYKIPVADELLTFYDRCAQWGVQLIVQEWIEGTDANNYTCNCYFSCENEPLATFVSRKLRQWPPQTGEGCFGEECRNDIVLNETVRLFKSVQYRGLGYMEMKRDNRSGEYFITEPNIGRPTGRSALAEACGVELLYTMYCDALGWELPANREQKYENAKWIFLRRDIQSAFHYWRRGELTIVDWLHSLRGQKVYALFSWTDLGPFIGDLLRSFRIVFQKVKI